ncbi:MAG: MFS transporter [Zavarzinella sp.]
MTTNSQESPSQKPTGIRFRMMFFTMCVAFFMYNDRACLAQFSTEVKRDLGLSPGQWDWVLSAFFWSYALAQVPAGLLGVRLGFTRTLGMLLILWSFFTAVSGMAAGFAALLAARLAIGVTEAGAYPNSAAIIRNWFPVASRGRANSIVALGGRLGWACSQFVTPLLMVLFISIILGLGNSTETANKYGWRLVMIFFGLIGIIWGFFYLRLAKDHPTEHPASNAAEAALVGPSTKLSQDPFPWKTILSSYSMWIYGFIQFAINVGWVFLITKLPQMLDELFRVSAAQRGVYSALPAMVSVLGLFLGGITTDYVGKRMGVRWGRSLPLAFVLFLASLAYLGAYWWIGSLIPLMIMLCIVSLSSDLGNPPLWAFSQDVGGKFAGAALGWGNMWGNLGAAVSPVALGLLWSKTITHNGWNLIMLACAISYALAGISALFLNANHKLIADPPMKAR